MGTVKVDNLVNQSGDQDSGLDLSTNDQVLVKTANATRVTVTDAATTVANTLTASTGITVSDGDIAMANGHGISFAATSDTGGMTSELLDDYEEGTFTPAFQGSTGSAGSYATSLASGNYTKIGDTVRIAIYIIVTNYGSWSGTAQVTGLPFTGKGAGSLGIAVSYFPADTRQAPVSAYIGGTTMIFPKAHNSQSGGLSEKWQVSDLSTSKYIMAEGVYSI
tara:strand:+ start:2406 stop:3068 length:663 start_codon:yes stop_codon:yes gene_type:complete